MEKEKNIIGLENKEENFSDNPDSQDSPDIKMPDYYVDLAGRTDPEIDKLVKILSSEMDYGTGLGEIINVKDLPLSWQQHIEKRKAEGHLSEDKNTFTKAEIIKATKNPDSYTPDNLIDKVFARAKKEKIDFEDLPEAWQERLRDENIFGNFTVEYLKQRGALDTDLEKIKNQAKAKKLEALKEEIQKTASVYSPTETAGENPDTETSSVSGQTSVKKSWWKKLVGRFGF